MNEAEQDAPDAERRSRDAFRPRLAARSPRRRSVAVAAPRACPRRRELGGRGGLDPARYGDWETRGIASDF